MKAFGASLNEQGLGGDCSLVPGGERGSRPDLEGWNKPQGVGLGCPVLSCFAGFHTTLVLYVLGVGWGGVGDGLPLTPAPASGHLPCVWVFVLGGLGVLHSLSSAREVEREKGDRRKKEWREVGWSVNCEAFGFVGCFGHSSP